jgi:hypothetical protein
MKQMMSIRVFNLKGDQIKLSPEVKTALESAGLEAETVEEAKWDELLAKIGRILKDAGFEVLKLQPEIDYVDTKKGKIIQEIKFNYWGA